MICLQCFRALLAAAAVAIPAAALAQQTAPATVWPDPPGMRQPPAQAPQGAKKPRAKPARAAQPAGTVAQEPGAAAAAAPKRAAKPAAGALDIRCDGPFAKDANQDQLAKAFGTQNVVAQGDAAGGGASTVVFPNDPKRRLEITWHDAAAKRRPASIIVEAQSTWRARGFRLGEPLAAVEKANGKPFKLAGFVEETGGVARDWQGGALDKLSGGCQLGMRFVADPKAPADARNKVAGDSEFLSDNPQIRAVKPTIAELIVGYPE